MKEIPSNVALAQTAHGLVLPEQLAHQAADAVRELLAEAAAANTTRSYASALRYWAGCDVPPPSVARRFRVRDQS